MSNWINHVKNYAEENNISYKEALTEAKTSYQQLKGGSARSDIVARILVNNPKKFNPNKIKNPSKYIKNDKHRHRIWDLLYAEERKKLAKYPLDQHQIREEIKRLEKLDRRKKENKDVDIRIADLREQGEKQKWILSSLYDKKNNVSRTKWHISYKDPLDIDSD